MNPSPTCLATSTRWPVPDLLPSLWQRLLAGHPSTAATAERLRAHAEELCHQPAPTVTSKVPTRHSPTTDPHDYVSIATYLHPDPRSADGLPYVSRDGVPSPDQSLYDRPRWDGAASAIIHAVRAGVVLAEQRFAADAARRLRCWFVDPDTRMAPHLRFAQMIPGVVSGRPVGIIDMALYLPEVLQAERLLAESPESPWKAADADALAAWCAALLDWLDHSELGQREGEAHNNHGTCFDRLVVALAVRLDRRERAVAQLDRAMRRIATQIAPDGSMPHELGRTCSFGYTALNVSAFVDLATAGRQLGVDLWGWRDHAAGNIPAAVDFVYRHACASAPWPYPEREPIDWCKFAALLLKARGLAGADAWPLAGMRHRLPDGFDAEAYLLVEPIHPFGQARSPGCG